MSKQKINDSEDQINICGNPTEYTTTRESRRRSHATYQNRENWIRQAAAPDGPKNKFYRQK